NPPGSSHLGRRLHLRWRERYERHRSFNAGQCFVCGFGAGALLCRSGEEAHTLTSMIHIKRILCPTDLSPHSEDAVRYALALSRAHEAELVLLHCTNDVDGEYKLATSVSEYIDPSDSKRHFVIAPAENVDEQIIVRAEAARADLIVMRSRRRPHRA